MFLFTAIGLAGFFYLKYQVTQFQRAARQELTAVAELKVNQIARWYSERLSDAGYFFEAPEMARSVQSFLDDPLSPKRQTEILSLLNTTQRNFHYTRILLFDRNQKMRLAVPKEKGWVGPRTQTLVHQTFQSGKIGVADLDYTQAGPKTIVLRIFVPLIPGSGIFSQPVDQ